MIKKIFPVVIGGLGILGFSVQAQSLKVVEDTLDFGTTTELTASGAQLSIYNTGFGPLDVVDIDYFKIYGDAPFTAADTAFTVPPGDTHTVQLTFLPEHNISHQMALVIKTNSGFGHIPVTVKGQGSYSKSYYASTENKTEQALRTALKSRISQGYNSLGYNTARDNMFMTIDNQKTNGQGASVNTLECVYTGTTITGYSSRAAAQNGNPQFNTEHTFPQGMFNSNEPMKSDLFHLYPTTNTSNSQRGNDPFGVVSNPTWSQGGSKSGNGKFEPRDVQKGRAARSMMYFVLRYQDYANFFQSQEGILRSWHNQFPPDSVEINRNAAIENVQNNRNPFIDYPQFTERMTSLVTNASPAVNQKLYTSDDTIRLVQGGGYYVYDYVLYNDGNETINLDNFSLSDATLGFHGGNPGSFSLEPREFYTVAISFNSVISYQAALDFSTDIPNQANISVPIRAGRSIGLEEANPALIELYPNPVDDFVHVSLENTTIEKIWISNSTGMKREVSLNGNSEIDLSRESAGIYLLTIISRSGEMHSAKVVVY